MTSFHVWSKLFVEAQGYNVNENLVYRDNQSSMKLELNGKASSGKRTRHFNIKYFFITDLIHRGEVKTEYCPTEYMIADYMTKPLLGRKFHLFRQAIMNLQPKKLSYKDVANKALRNLSQECVGQTDRPVAPGRSLKQPPKQK